MRTATADSDIRVRSRRSWPGALRRHIPLLIAAAILLFPFMWVVLASFKTSGEIARVPPSFLPANPTMDAFDELFRRLRFERYFLNTVVVAGASSLIASVAASLAGFVFAKYRFRGSRIAYGLLLAQMFLPIAVWVLPLHNVFASAHLKNTYLALIAPYAVSGFGVFLMRQFMRTVPDEMLEAGRIEGARDLQLYRMIALPLTRSALAGVFVFTFLFVWTQFWWPLVITNAPDMQTVTLAVANSAISLGTRYDILAAGAALSIIPIIIVFLLATRQVLSSVTFGGMRES